MCAGTADVNQDGHTDLLVKILAFQDALPRTLIAFDIHNQKTIWKFDSGAAILDIITVAPANAPGFILCGTLAYGNGANYNGIDDSDSYLLKIDTKSGKLIEKTKMGEWTSAVLVRELDFDGDDKKEIAVIVTGRERIKAEPGRVTIWEHQFDSKIKEIAMPYVLENHIEIADIDGNGSDDIFILSQNGKELGVVSNKLDTLVSINFRLFPILCWQLI